MDQEIAKQLEAAGLPTRLDDLTLSISRTGPGFALIVGDGKKSHSMALKPCSALFAGSRQPPPMHGEPPEEYTAFFATIETAAALACAASGHAEPDDEFERLYRYLKKRPDGIDRNPMFAALQDAARLYMSLHDVSQAEYEAVMDRLSRSARTFSLGKGSTNYFHNALVPLLGEG